MRKLILISIFVFVAVSLYAHDATVPIIIDTDCGVDDLRAITLLLAQDNLDVKAIITSDGVCDPFVGADKVRRLLASFGRTDIKIAVGRRSGKKEPFFRANACQAFWGEPVDGAVTLPSALELLSKLLVAEGQSYLYLALGPVSNLDELQRSYPEKLQQLQFVYWSCDGLVERNGFNYQRDAAAAEWLLDSQIDLLIFDDPASIPYDQVLHQALISFFNPYCDAIRHAHERQPLAEMLKAGHFRLWDELMSAWLFDHTIASSTRPNGERYELVSKFSPVETREAILNIAENAGGRRKNVVMRQFPMKPSEYCRDLAPYVDQIITDHGEEEFRLVTMTNELHRHLGIYSIVGAKMGLKAREVLGTRLDELEVVSFSGPHPPLSCLCDGLQVSTGATLGQGMISIADEVRGPVAKFSKSGQSIVLSLKPKYVKQVRNDIAAGVKKYGNLTPAYWRFIRELAIRYWVQWSRDEIFALSEVIKSN